MRFIALAALVVIGALNREMTGVLIWLMLFVAYPKRWQWWLPCGVLLAAIVIGLRLLIDAPNSYTLARVWLLNHEVWRLRNVALYGGLLVCPALLILSGALRSSRRILLMMAGVLVPYLLLYAAFGIWQEVRLLMPVFLLGVPVLSRVAAYRRDTAEVSS